MAKNAKAQTTTENQQGQEGTTQAQEAPAKGPKLAAKKKLTVREVYGPIDQKRLPPLRINVTDDNPEGDPNPNSELKLCRIVGYATGTTHGESSYGAWAALTGEFVATSYDSGEVFAGKNAIVPGPMGDMLVTNVEAILAEDANGQVRFSVDIFAKRSARDPQRKYEYVVRPVIDAKLSSPALELLGLEE